MEMRFIRPASPNSISNLMVSVEDFARYSMHSFHFFCALVTQSEGQGHLQYMHIEFSNDHCHMKFERNWFIDITKCTTTMFFDTNSIAAGISPD